jgi:hypothetical protein
VWDAIDAHKMVSFEVRPEDFYSRNDGDGVLLCSEVVPLIKTIGLHVVTPDNDAQNQVLNGINRRFAGYGGLSQSFVTPGGPVVYELAQYVQDKQSVPSVWQLFELPVRYGESETAQTTFLAGPRQTRPVGLSASGTFDVDFSVLVDLAGHGGFDHDTSVSHPPSAVQLIMEIDSRQSGTFPTWVSRCR